MRFHWTKESFGYALRDSNNYARATIVRPQPWQFWGQIITSNMPDSGPYKSRKEASDWVTGALLRLELVPADSLFSEIPQERAAA